MLNEPMYFAAALLKLRPGIHTIQKIFERLSRISRKSLMPSHLRQRNLV